VDNIIQGSYNSFAAGGFNYTPFVSTDVDTTLKWSYADLADRKVYTQPGIFKLSICDPSEEWPIAKFLDNIGYPGYGHTTRHDDTLAHHHYNTSAQRILVHFSCIQRLRLSGFEALFYKRTCTALTAVLSSHVFR
jgi:hypothetical protein